MATTEITEILNRKRGQSIIYHVGHIAIDAHPTQIDAPNIVPRWEHERQAIADTKKLADRFYEDGICTLVQRRLGTHQYEYIAQRL